MRRSIPSTITALIATALAVGLLSACGTSSEDGMPGETPQTPTVGVRETGVPDGDATTYPGLPTSPATEVEQSLGDATPSVVWLTEPDRFAVVTWGSSSCPLAASGLQATPPDQLTVTFTSSSEGVCTADLAPWTHEFTVPDDVTGRPITVTIEITGQHIPTVLTLE